MQKINLHWARSKIKAFVFKNIKKYIIYYYRSNVFSHFFHEFVL